MLYTVGIIISLFLCLLLLGKKQKNAADYLLSCWMGWIGIHLTFYYLTFSERIFDFPSLLGWALPMPLMHPPLLYLYTATLCRGALPKRWWWHFVPILACYLYLIPFSLLPAEEKIYVYKHHGVGYEVFMLLIDIGIYVSGVAYTFIAWRMLQKHRRVIGELFSNEEKINLLWLQYLIVGLAGIWLTVLVGNETVIYSGAVLFVLFIGYFGIRQVGIFTDAPTQQLVQARYDAPDLPFSFEISESLFTPSSEDETTPAESIAKDKRKYEKSGLSAKAAEILYHQLQDLMVNQQLYKESELSLTDLAERLDTHPNYLSQIINEKAGKNFYDYVNSMRTDAFLDMAADPDSRRYTIFALALECGFNSKTAFNRYFKKVTGQSPSEYLKMEVG